MGRGPLRDSVPSGCDGDYERSVRRRDSARSLASVITVGGLNHENNTLGIKLYLSNSSVTTEQGVNTTSSVHLYIPLLNHAAHKAKQAGWGEAVPARMCHGKSR